MKSRGRILTLFAAGLLAACSAPSAVTSTVPPPADTVIPTAESAAPVEPTLTGPPTDAPLDEVYDTPYPTPASPTGAPTASPERCSTEPDTDGLDALTWTEIDTPSGPLRQLSGFEKPVIGLDPGPDGRWWVVTLRLDLVMGASQTAALLIDTQGDDHRWLNREWWETDAYDWLPDGRLLWFDTNGCLFIRQADNVQLLGTFGTIIDTKPAGSVVFVKTDYTTPPVRVSLQTGEAEIVDYEPVENYGYEIDVANNGSYGLIFKRLPDSGEYPETDYQVWRLPAQMGASSEGLVSFPLAVVGRGGALTLPPTQLAASSYWYNPLGVWGGVGLPIVEGYVVDIATGNRLGEADFDLPEGMHIWGYEPSPDGRWLAVFLIRESEEYTGRMPGHLLIVSAADLETGGLFEIQPGQRAHNSFLNWHPDGALVQRAPNGERVVQQLPLDVHPTAALDGAGEWVANLPGRILTTAPDAPATARLYHLSSAFLGEIDLSQSYGLLTAAGRSGDTLYLGAATTVNTQQAIRCPCALVEWPDSP